MEYLIIILGFVITSAALMGFLWLMFKGVNLAREQPNKNNPTNKGNWSGDGSKQSFSFEASSPIVIIGIGLIGSMAVLYMYWQTVSAVLVFLIIMNREQGGKETNDSPS